LFNGNLYFQRSKDKIFLIQQTQNTHTHTHTLPISITVLNCFYHEHDFDIPNLANRLETRIIITKCRREVQIQSIVFSARTGNDANLRI